MTDASRISLTDSPQISLTDLRMLPPTVPDSVLSVWAAELFGVSGPLAPLQGERDQNRLLDAGVRGRFVLKVSSALEDPSTTDFQTQALLHLEAVAPDLPVPRVQRTLRGAPQARMVTDDGVRHVVRLLTFLPGHSYEDVEHVSASTLWTIGEFQGRLCRALAGFTHPAEATFMPWDISNGLLAADALWDGLGADAAGTLAPVRRRLVEEVLPAMTELRAQVIHNDAHRANLLRADATSQELVGLIDFGDLVHAPLAADLAASTATFVDLGDDPVAPVIELAAGFDSVMPLEDREVDLLHDLVLARLTLAVLLIDLRIAAPDVPAADILAVRPFVLAWTEAWRTVEPSAFAARLRARLGRTSPV